MRKRSKTISTDNHTDIGNEIWSENCDSDRSIKEEPIEESNTDNTGPWSKEESEKLFDLINVQIPSNDKNAYYHRISKIDWAQITIENRSVSECKQQLNVLLKNVRHVRLLSELIDEARFNLNNKKPRNLSAFNLFCRDLKKTTKSSDNSLQNFFLVASKSYHALPQSEKEKYQSMAASQKVSKEKKTTKGPKTPLQFYLNHHIGQKGVSELKQEYKNFTNEEKMNWIEKAVDEIGRSTLTLSKAEESILKSKGKPKRPLNPYILFMQELSHSDKSITFKEASIRYNQLSSDVRQSYKRKAAELKLKYNRDVLLHKAKQMDIELEKSISDNILSDLGHTLDATDCADIDEITIDQHEPNHISTPKPDSKIKQSSIKDTKSHPVDSAINSPRNDKSTNSPLKDNSSIASRNDEDVKSPRKNEMAKSSQFSLSMDNERNHKKKSKRLLSPSSSMLDTNDEWESQTESELHSPKKRKKNKRKSESIDEHSKSQEGSQANLKCVSEPDSPPANPFEYYVKYEFKGKAKKAKRAFENLSLEDKKRIKQLHKKCVSSYMKELKAYLSTLTKEEMLEYSDRTSREKNIMT